jgi:hypothetical protein
MTDEAELSPYLCRLPIGERLSIDPVRNDELFPLEGEILVKRLEPPIIPEPHRKGEAGREPCWPCEHMEEGAIWSNANWVVGAHEGHGLPAVAVLMPRAHHDLNDLPAGLASELGVIIKRVSRAISALPDTGRVHVNRWGDGSEHFHLWFLVRPKGMWQMRGAMLAIWDDLLPKVPSKEWNANLRTVAEALATEDGSVLI